MKMTSCKNPKIILIIAILETAVLLGLLWLICPVSFETYDDMAIMNMVSGFYTGTPAFQTYNGLFIWGKILTTLYGFTGILPWYALVFMFLIFISLVDICFHLITVVNKIGKTITVGIASFAFLFFSIFCFYSSRLQFTTISALCGTAVIVNICAVTYLEDKSWRVANYIMTCIFYLFACNIRCEIGYLLIAVCFFTVFLNKYLTRRMKNGTAIVYLCLLSGILISSYSINRMYEYISGGLEYREFNDEKVAYMDYSYVAYGTNPEVYDEIGWSDNLASLVRSWYLLDDAITVDAFMALNKAKEEDAFNFKEALQQIIKWNVNIVNEGFEIQLTDEIHLQIILWFWLVVFASIYCFGKKKWRNFFEIWAYFMAFAVIEMYFVYQGRLPLRLIESIIYIFMIPGIFSIIMVLNPVKNQKDEYIAGILGLCIAVVMIMPIGMWNKVYTISNSETRKLSEQTRTMMEEYAINHSNNIYVCDYSLSMPGNPLTVYPDKKPLNLFYWGGWDIYSPPYYDKLKINGLTSFHQDNFFDDNVFFMMNNDSLEGSLFYSYMLELYPDCYYVIAEETDYFVVYKFIK